MICGSISEKPPPPAAAWAQAGDMNIPLSFRAGALVLARGPKGKEEPRRRGASGIVEEYRRRKAGGRSRAENTGAFQARGAPAQRTRLTVKRPSALRWSCRLNKKGT